MWLELFLRVAGGIIFGALAGLAIHFAQAAGPGPVTMPLVFGPVLLGFLGGGIGLVAYGHWPRRCPRCGTYTREERSLKVAVAPDAPMNVVNFAFHCTRCDIWFRKKPMSPELWRAILYLIAEVPLLFDSLEQFQDGDSIFGLLSVAFSAILLSSAGITILYHNKLGRFAFAYCVFVVALHIVAAIWLTLRHLGPSE